MPDIFVSPSVSPEKDAASTAAKVSMQSPKKSSPALQPTSSMLAQIFSPFLFMPEGIRFETQEPKETVILFLRQHWVTNFFWLSISFLFLLLPLILFPGIFYSGLLPVQFSLSLVEFFVLVWYLGIFSYAFVNFLLWYFTVSIVTNERIIDIDFVNILNKKFAATRITKVEDVTMRKGGIMEALFDYGQVTIQTAAKEVMFEFDHVPHPDKVVRIINNLMGKKEE